MSAPTALGLRTRSALAPRLPRVKTEVAALVASRNSLTDILSDHGLPLTASAHRLRLFCVAPRRSKVYSAFACHSVGRCACFDPSRTSPANSASTSWLCSAPSVLAQPQSIRMHRRDSQTRSLVQQNKRAVPCTTEGKNLLCYKRKYATARWREQVGGCSLA